jgi:hypothetical protein
MPLINKGRTSKSSGNVHQLVQHVSKRRLTSHGPLAHNVMNLRAEIAEVKKVALLSYLMISDLMVSIKAHGGVTAEIIDYTADELMEYIARGMVPDLEGTENLLAAIIDPNADDPIEQACTRNDPE